jgi:hypothetical protein
MKNIILFFALVSFSHQAMATGDPIWDAFTSAMTSGNASGLSIYFDENVALTLDNQDFDQPRSQALATFQKWIAARVSKSFTLVHAGNNKGKSSWYSIGEADTAQGKFRVFVYFRTTGSKTTIQEIRISRA